jgi:NAD(P)-dependent dehydrogenase (short-subunit alcohol dehydrogenase family)
MKFINKTAIITGGGSGIGQAVAIEAASQGANVVVADIDKTSAEETVGKIQEIKGTGIAIPTDLRNHKQIKDLCIKTVEAFGSIDLLCYSAGIQTYGTAVSADEKLWDDTMDVNLKGMFLTAKYCIPEMIRQGGGGIVNISSVQAFACQQNVAAYAASKGGAVALTRAMALDHASDNIRVNCICPGSIDTPMLKFGAGKHGNTEEVIKEWGNNHPIGRVGKPSEIAKTVMFLWSEDSGFITAQPIIVDGGLISGIF